MTKLADLGAICLCFRWQLCYLKKLSQLLGSLLMQGRSVKLDI